MRAVFFGTPEFAVPSLDALREVADVRAVVVQPDRPRGRGRNVEPPAVKARAEEHGLPILQPEKLKQLDLVVELRSFDVDVFVVVAYGRILPPVLLEIPKHGCVNVHGSLLPRHRGAAPVQWAILSGDRETGVTLMKLDEGMDTGPVLSSAKTEIEPEVTAGELALRLSNLGANLLRTDLPKYVRGSIQPQAQDEKLATRAPPLRKEEGRIDWKRPSRAVHDHVRAMNPWPGATTTLADKDLKIHRTAVADERPAGPPGRVERIGPEGMLVACGDGSILVVEAQVAGRKRLPAGDLARGLRLDSGVVLK